MKEQKPKKFSVKMQKKLLCLYALIILAFILLSVRLTWIVKADGAAYEKQVLSQQKYDSITLPFRRGDIVDAKGTKLAVRAALSAKAPSFFNTFLFIRSLLLVLGSLTLKLSLPFVTYKRHPAGLSTTSPSLGRLNFSRTSRFPKSFSFQC